MNFSDIEDSILEEKKKFNNFLSRFLKNSRVLIILLTAAVIAAVSVSIWIKSPEYQILYNHLSNEDSGAVINELNQMKIPYQFTEVAGQISVPKNKVYEIRLRLAENNLPRGGGIGFELLDKEKFGISQFNEQINYQRALEGELARTIQRINIVKSARIHIAFPKSSLFLEDKKKPSASAILELQSGHILDDEKINAILHLISSSVSNLSVENITIVDQLGNLLNQPTLGYRQINNSQLKYSEDIEARYSNRIKRILEPLVGVGNVYAQVTAQLDFNDQEKTQEKYSPNSKKHSQSIRSHQTSIHDQIQNNEDVPSALTNIDKNKYNRNTILHNNNLMKNSLKNSNINRDNTINYELNHSVLHTKMNIGEIKRLSAAVVINFLKDKDGKFVPLTTDEIKNVKNLIREAIGYSKDRGDSIHFFNTSFFKYHKKNEIQPKNVTTLQSSYDLFSLAPWLLSILFLLILLKKYFFSVSKNKKDNHEKQYLENHQDMKKNNDLENIEDNLNTDKLIHKISNIANHNPRTIALIIRQWMSDKI